MILYKSFCVDLPSSVLCHVIVLDDCAYICQKAKAQIVLRDWEVIHTFLESEAMVTGNRQFQFLWNS